MIMNSIIDQKSIIEIERQPRKSGGPRIVYKLKCKNKHCNNIISIRKTEINLGINSRFCKSCSHQKRPFESIYNYILKLYKNDNVLTYDEFITYTKINKCHYCYSPIHWIPFGTVKGEFISRAYFLDRKDSSLPYINTNIVVCCTRCNRGKSNKFSYEEWYGMTSYFRNKINNNNIVTKHVGQVFIEGGDVCSLKGGSCNS